MNKKERIEWIDNLKAFACVLVCVGHLLQSFQKAGIDNYENITSYINTFIYFFHMPLFMCLSGYLYYRNKEEFSWHGYKEFVKKKFINLIIPYLTFYLLYLGINIVFSNSVNTPKGIEELKGIINNPMAPYWFLYALLSIFAVIPLLEKLCKNNAKLVFSILLILKIVSLFISLPIYFIRSTMMYGLYFYIGAFISDKTNSSNNIFRELLLEFIYISFFSLIYYFNNTINSYLYEILKVFCAVFQIILFSSVLKKMKNLIVFDTFKKYTFQIYVLHTIFAAGIRIVMLQIGINNYILHFSLGLLCSIYMPVLIGLISEKIVYTDFFFYPLKTIKKVKERKLSDV